jgi:putative PEP-CTERM system TPR-repeat lipoprotein
MINRTSLAALFVAVWLAGCHPSSNPQQLLAEARQFETKGDFKSALIQAKNAVQADPNLAEAHFVVGAIYMDLGQWKLAEAKIREALALKMDPNQGVPMLARSLLRQDKFQDVLDETVVERIPEAGRSPQVAALRGDANLGLLRIPAAKTAFETALQLDAEHPDALVGLGKIAANDRRPEEGMQLVMRALAKSPNHFDALLFQGDLFRVLNDPMAAIAAYEKAVAQRSDDTNARLTLASLQIALDKREDAAANLAAVLALAPQSPTANYLQAVLLFRAKDYVAAQSHAMEVLKVQPTHAQTVILAGAAEYVLADYARAEQHLKWALDRYPEYLYVRKLLVATYTKSKKVQDAIETLQPALKQASEDANLLTLAGDVYMEAGQFTRATQYFDKAVSIENSTSNQLAATASRLASGEIDRVIADLEKVLTLDPSQTRAGIMLAMAQMRRGDFDKALEVVNRLEKESPRNPIIRNLKGSAYAGKKDFAKARRAFEEALAMQSIYFPAAANLAQLDVRDKNYSDARNRYYAVLDRDGSNVEAMLALAELFTGMPDKADESVQWAQRAFQLQPRDPRIALAVAKYYLAAGNRPRTLETVRQATTLGQFDFRILEEAARLQLEAGGTTDALDTYLKIAKVNPKSPDVQFRLAQMQYLNGSSAIAKQTLMKALELKPDMQEAQILLARLEATVGNRDGALKMLEKIKKPAPNSFAAFMVEGDIEMLSKRYLPAAKAYERAYALKTSGNLAAQIYEAYLRGGKPEVGESVVLKWLDNQAADTATRIYLADASIRTSRLPTAIAQYEWLAQKAPADQQVLNNLAWAYGETGDARALATAEKAFRMNEANAAVADTYGSMLLHSGKIAEAAGVLRRAVEIAPGARDIRFHYAQALSKLGERKDARAELQRVLAGAGPFDRQAEAKSLLEELKN